MSLTNADRVRKMLELTENKSCTRASLDAALDAGHAIETADKEKREFDLLSGRCLQVGRERLQSILNDLDRLDIMDGTGIYLNWNDFQEGKDRYDGSQNEERPRFEEDNGNDDR